MMETLKIDKLQIIKDSIISFFDGYNDKIYHGSVTFEYEHEKVGNKDFGELEINLVKVIHLIVDITKIVSLQEKMEL